jgi:hypothetical protein
MNNGLSRFHPWESKVTVTSEVTVTFGFTSSKISECPRSLRVHSVCVGGSWIPAGLSALRIICGMFIETAWDWGVAHWAGTAKYSENPDMFWLIREVEIRFHASALRHNDKFDLTIWLVNWQRSARHALF